MHYLRIRLIVIVVVVIILWQIFRNWPGSDENLANQAQRAAGSPVMVMVFYEALCPDSKHFILKQLEPTYSKASALIDFQLVPYGKATVIFYAIFFSEFHLLMHFILLNFRPKQIVMVLWSLSVNTVKPNVRRTFITLAPSNQFKINEYY